MEVSCNGSQTKLCPGSMVAHFRAPHLSMGVAQRTRTQNEYFYLRESVLVGLQALCASFVQLFGGLHLDEDSYPPITFEGFVQKETGTARQRPSFAEFA